MFTGNFNISSKISPELSKEQLLLETLKKFRNVGRKIIKQRRNLSFFFIESHSLQSYITKIMYTNMIGDGVNTNRGLIALFITHTKLHTTSHVWIKDTHTHTTNKSSDF